MDCWDWSRNGSIKTSWQSISCQAEDSCSYSAFGWWHWREFLELFSWFEKVTSVLSLIPPPHLSMFSDYPSAPGKISILSNALLIIKYLPLTLILYLQLFAVDPRVHRCFCFFIDHRYCGPLPLCAGSRSCACRIQKLNHTKLVRYVWHPASYCITANKPWSHIRSSASDGLLLLCDKYFLVVQGKRKMVKKIDIVIL